MRVVYIFHTEQGLYNEGGIIFHTEQCLNS